jgi:cytochrome oxidase Cu insertion factor (SCO1/SenC/PrrC family)
VKHTIPMVGAEPTRIGALVADFTIRDPDGRAASYSALTGHLIVLIFISTRCPMSNAHNYRLNILHNELAGGPNS